MDDFPRPILAAIETEASAVRAGLVMASPEWRAVAERVLAFARASSGALEVDVQGALGAVLAQSVAHASVMEHLVDVWIARGGAAFAVRAAIAQRKLVATHPRDARKPGGFDRSVRWLEPRKRAQLVAVLDVPTWEALRSAAKRTKRDERTALAVATSELRAELALPLRVWLDGIMPDARAAIEDIEALATADEADARDAIPWCPPLFAALALEPGELTKRAGATLLERSSHDATATARLPEYACDAVALLGADAAPGLVALLSAAHAARTLDPRAQKKLAEALLEIDSPAVAQFFGTMVESKVLRTIAVEYMKKHAARAVSVLGTGRAASNVLREIAHSHPEEMREGLAELDAPEDDAGVAARKLVEKALKQTAGGREATDDELPWVLREPPWRRSKARPAGRVVMTFPAITFEEKHHLLDRDIDEAEPGSPVARLASEGIAAIDVLVSLAPSDIDDATFFALRRIESPRVAPIMAALRRTSRRAQSDNWLGQYADAAAAGLLPIALGPTSREQATASAALLATVAQGRAKAVRRTAARFGEDVLAATEEWLALAPLHETPERAPRLPAYADPVSLPRIALKNGALIAPRAATLVAEMMYFSDPDAPYAGLAQVKNACDQRVLDAWLVSLMQAWVEAGSQPAGAWVLSGLAQLGGVDATRELARAIKSWSRTRDARSLALTGLEALASGDAPARTALADFARKGLRGETAEKAEDLLRAMARKQGLSEDDAADTLTPTLDLEANGTCVLDYGPRRFVVSLDEHLVPCIADEENRKVRDAPRVRKLDDPLKARTASQQLKSLKKGLGEVARGAIFRFETAMVNARRYRRAVFDAVDAHPILGRIARRLIWVVDGTTTTFRIIEDGTFADETDRAIMISPDDDVRIIHPLTLHAPLTMTWGERFADYELLQPFPQLGRATFTATPDERVTQSVTRFRGASAPFMAICGRLESRGWRRLDPVEGAVRGYWKRFGDSMAVYEFAEPIVFGQPMPEATTVGVIRFREPLERIGAIAFSEAAYDLHVFTNHESA